MTDKSFRMPLQTGASALRDLLVGAMSFVPGYILIACAIVGIFALPATLTVWLVLMVVGVLVALFGAHQLKKAVRDRPSDLVIDGVGLRIEGGPHQAGYFSTSVPWRELASDAWRVRQVIDTNKWELVTGPIGTELVLAHATDLDEIQSLWTVADMAQSTAAHLAGEAQHPTSVGTLVCPACGAPVRADDAESVLCTYCQHGVDVPPEMRERIRAARQLGAAQRVTPLLLQRVLAQPSARKLNMLGVIAGASMLVVWPAVVGFGGWLYHLDRLGALSVVALVALAPASILLVHSLAVAATVNRRALQRVGLNCSARTDASGHPECRLCGAVLTAGDQVVLACPYCGASNILGLDLRSAARDALAEEQELQSTLDLDASQRARARAQAGLAVAAFAVGMLLLAAGYFVG